MDGIMNFLSIINDNWTTIIVIISLIIGIYEKAKDVITKSDNGKIEIAKEQIQQIALKLITDAESDYSEWKKSGAVKRSQVIKKIYEQYPILLKVADQNELVEWLDGVIDDGLHQLSIIAGQSDTKNKEE